MFSYGASVSAILMSSRYHGGEGNDCLRHRIVNVIEGSITSYDLRSVILVKDEDLMLYRRPSITIDRKVHPCVDVLHDKGLLGCVPW